MLYKLCIIVFQKIKIILTDPKTIAPVYLNGRRAASPYIVFWYIPLATASKGYSIINGAY